MCRGLAYLGEPLALADLLHRPAHSLVAQSVDPQQLPMLNLAGFGLVAWTGDDAEPLVYRSTALPVYDRNLASLARHVRSGCWLAHVRGVPYRPEASFGDHNLHPFLHPGARLALAHNGDLSDFGRLRPALLRRMAPERVLAIGGTTDSEWLYALLLQCLGDAPVTLETLAEALRALVAVLREARAEVGIDTSSAMNLFLSDGETIAAVRYTFDFGRYPLDPARAHEAGSRYLSLWYAVGDRFVRDARGHFGPTPAEGAPRTVVCASEPLSADPAGWVEVPEYGAVLATRQAHGGLRLTSLDLDD